MFNIEIAGKHPTQKLSIMAWVKMWAVGGERKRFGSLRPTECDTSHQVTGLNGKAAGMPVFCIFSVFDGDDDDDDQGSISDAEDASESDALLPQSEQGDTSQAESSSPETSAHEEAQTQPTPGQLTTPQADGSTAGHLTPTQNEAEARVDTPPGGELTSRDAETQTPPEPPAVQANIYLLMGTTDVTVYEKYFQRTSPTSGTYQYTATDQNVYRLQRMGPNCSAPPEINKADDVSLATVALYDAAAKRDTPWSLGDPTQDLALVQYKDLDQGQATSPGDSLQYSELPSRELQSFTQSNRTQDVYENCGTSWPRDAYVGRELPQLPPENATFDDEDYEDIYDHLDAYPTEAIDHSGEDSNKGLANHGWGACTLEGGGGLQLPPSFKVGCALYYCIKC